MRDDHQFPSQEFADLTAAFNEKFWSPQHQKVIEIRANEIISDGRIIDHIHEESELLLLWNEYLHQLQENPK